MGSISLEVLPIRLFQPSTIATTRRTVQPRSRPQAAGPPGWASAASSPATIPSSASIALGSSRSSRIASPSLAGSSRYSRPARHLAAALTRDVIEAVAQQLPDAWLGEAHGFDDPSSHRAAYAAWLSARVEAMPVYLEEAERAHARRV